MKYNHTPQEIQHIMEFFDFSEADAIHFLDIEAEEMDRKIFEREVEDDYETT